MDNNLELVIAAQKGDNEARDKLVSENSRLIWSIVRRFKGRPAEADDLFQIGAIGLLKCIDKFDMSYGVKFSTYAVPMIMGEIKRFLRDDGMIKVSRTLKELSQKAKTAESIYIQKNGKEPTVSELAEIVGVEPGELVLAMEASYNVESLYQTASKDDTSSPIYLIDKVKSVNDEEKIINEIAVKELITRLLPTERKVIVLRYFSDKTQVETAKVIGISQVQVSRIEKKALTKMREGYGSSP